MGTKLGELSGENERLRAEMREMRRSINQSVMDLEQNAGSRVETEKMELAGQLEAQWQQRVVGMEELLRGKDEQIRSMEQEALAREEGLRRSKEEVQDELSKSRREKSEREVEIRVAEGRWKERIRELEDKLEEEKDKEVKLRREEGRGRESIVDSWEDGRRRAEAIQGFSKEARRNVEEEQESRDDVRLKEAEEREELEVKAESDVTRPEDGAGTPKDDGKRGREKDCVISPNISRIIRKFRDGMAAAVTPERKKKKASGDGKEEEEEEDADPGKVPNPYDLLEQDGWRVGTKVLAREEKKDKFERARVKRIHKAAGIKMQFLERKFAETGGGEVRTVLSREPKWLKKGAWKELLNAGTFATS